MAPYNPDLTPDPSDSREQGLGFNNIDETNIERLAGDPSTRIGSSAGGEPSSATAAAIARYHAWVARREEPMTSPDKVLDDPSSWLGSTAKGVPDEEAKAAAKELYSAFLEDRAKDMRDPNFNAEERIREAAAIEIPQGEADAEKIFTAIEDRRRLDKTPSELQEDGTTWDNIKGVARKTAQMLSALLGPSGEVLEFTNYLLQATTRVANAANAVKRVPDSPLGRRLFGRNEVEARRIFWAEISNQLTANIDTKEFRDTLPDRRGADELGRTQGEVPLADALSNLDDQLAETPFTRPLLREGARDPEESIDGQGLRAGQSIDEAIERIDSLLANPRLWVTYSASSGGEERTEEARQSFDNFVNARSDNSMTNVGAGGEINNINSLLNNVENYGTGTAGASDSTPRTVEVYNQSRERASERDRNPELETEAARRARTSGNFGDLGPSDSPARDFLNWSSHRLRWGNSYTHLYEVQITDSQGYARDSGDPPGPILGRENGDAAAHRANLDFSGDVNALRFAAIGASVGGLNLTMSRTGAGDLPLPTGAGVEQNISLTILDYTRMSLYNWFYSWYLNFYNPHKRRFVGGKAGKYKDIVIKVQSWYGEYGVDELAAAATSQEGVAETIPDRQRELSVLNRKYDEVLTIYCHNCMLQDFPGMQLAWENSAPFQFEVGIVPSDVYYDFRNPQNYTWNSSRPHISEVYRDQVEAGRVTPDQAARNLGVDTSRVVGSSAWDS